MYRIFLLFQYLKNKMISFNDGKLVKARHEFYRNSYYIDSNSYKVFDEDKDFLRKRGIDEYKLTQFKRITDKPDEGYDE